MSELTDKPVYLKHRCLNCNVDVDSEQPIERCATCDGLYVRVVADPVVGTTIAGKYRVTALIGSGGMGRVYNAFHEDLKIEVALKMLPDTGMTVDRLMRFQHEAKLASSIVHQNIVRIKDFGVDPAPFLVMEKVAGETLSTVLQQLRALESSRAISICISICAAMEAAHKEGLLHRDLKPSNVMFDQSSGAVKIIDFGLAKAFVDDVKITRTGETVGSPPYMSPEQCRGEVLDARSDIYSLGCMMYELLTGRPPFQGQNMIAAIFQHLEEEAKTFQQVRPDLSFPKGLETVVKNCLHKNPETRYQSMFALQNDLLRVSQGKKVVALKPARKKRKVSKLLRILGLASAVLATVFVLMLNEQPLPVVQNGNELSTGKQALTRGSVFVKLQERQCLNGLNREQFFTLRRKQIDENRSLLQKNYQPFWQGFFQIDFGAPWLSFEGLNYKGEAGPSLTKGPSFESETILNPLLLVRAEVSDQPKWRRDFIGSDSAVISRFPFMGQPKTLLFKPVEQVSEATYDMTDYIERTLEMNDWKEYTIGEDSNVPVDVLSLNAWDFGYNFMSVTAENQNEVKAITKEPIRVCQIIHKVWRYHGVACNISHFPQGRPHGFYAAATTLKFPCTERVSLWKQQPSSAKQVPDFTCLLRFNLDVPQLTNVTYLKKRCAEVIANEGADSKYLLSIYRRLGDAARANKTNKSAQYYGQAIRIAGLHMNQAREDLLCWIMPEFLSVLTGDASDLSQIERIAFEQKWPAPTTALLKTAATTGKGLPVAFWNQLAYELSGDTNQRRTIDVCKKGLSYFPKEAYLYKSMARAQGELGKWKEAEASSRKALTLAPGGDEAACLVVLAWTLSEQNKLQEAIEACRNALKADPKCMSAYETLADAALESSDWGTAEKTAREGLALDSTNFPLALTLAIALDEKKQVKEADRAYERALKLAPDAEARATVKETLTTLRSNVEK